MTAKRGDSAPASPSTPPRPSTGTTAGLTAKKGESLASDTPSFAKPRRRIGLGLAAVGRPGYLNLGRERDLPPERTVSALRHRCHQLLDAAYAGGVRYVDVARSYGRAEEFLADWLHQREDVVAASDLVVGSKWGYTYTAGWRVRAERHEVKDHSLTTFHRQLAETRALLGNHLRLYQVHSVTPDSPLFHDTALRSELARLAADGVTVGISTSGPRQADAVRAALELTVDGRPLVRGVQSTWNLLEPSAGQALADAHHAGCQIIVKEAMANGRLARQDPGSPLALVAQEADTTCDAVALAAVLYQPWVGIALSGAATTEQLADNLVAATVRLSPQQLGWLATMGEPAGEYWARRAALPWR